MKEADKKTNDMRILIVQDDTPAAAEIVRHIVMNLHADITLVDTINDARDLIESRSFDVILADRFLSDGDGQNLLRVDCSSPPPIILLDEHPDTQRVLAAVRQGAADVMTTPIDPDILVDSIRRAVRQRRSIHRKTARAKRLRRLSSRLIKDRRELRRRVDLICSDLVGAYQRLAEKVVTVPDVHITGESLYEADEL
ncbi:MAG: response regulator [Phycisphaerae bacterium]